MPPRTPSTPAQKAELAFKAMHRAILEQALVPGTRLPEDQLCSQFGVSRTLVRAVLGRLAAQGLVDTGNKRTATVAQPSLEEARAVFEVRRGLEAQAVALVIERWQPAMGAVLEGHVREEELAAREGRVPVSARLAGEFHTTIAQLTGNPLLQRYLSEVVTRCSLVLAVYGRPHQADCACTEHHALIEALRSRDAVRAASLMAEHMDNIERRALLPQVAAGDGDLASVLSRYAGAVASTTAGVPLKVRVPAAARRRAAG